MSDQHRHGPDCQKHLAARVGPALMVTVAWSCGDGVLRNEWRASIEDDPADPQLQRLYLSGETLIDKLRSEGRHYV